MKVSIFEAIGALKMLTPTTTEDCENLETIGRYLEQQRQLNKS